jgi:hypothetical protein
MLKIYISVTNLLRPRPPRLQTYSESLLDSFKNELNQLIIKAPFPLALVARLGETLINRVAVWEQLHLNEWFAKTPGRHAWKRRLNSQSRVVRKKLIVAKLLQEITGTLWKQEIHYSVRSSLPLYPILSHLNPIHFTTYLFNIHLTLSYLRLGLTGVFILRFTIA